jgi:hypothetical protein
MDLGMAVLGAVDREMGVEVACCPFEAREGDVDREGSEVVLVCA